MSRLAVSVLTVALCLLAAAPAAARPHTTVTQTIVDRDGDDRLETGPGEDHVVRTLGATAASDRARRRKGLLFFGQMTDTHVIDEESPLRVEFTDRLGAAFTSAYRPHEGLSPQVLEAMVDQLRNTVSPVTRRRIELVMTTGDNTDNTQCNETRWMIDLMGGRTTVDPDSGLVAGEAPGGLRHECAAPVPPDPSVPAACDGTRAERGGQYDGVRGGGQYYEPDASDGQDGEGYSPRRAENGGDDTVRDFPGLFERMNEPFRATGFRDLPWYAVFGNHDGLVQGNQPRNPALAAYAMGCLKVTDLTAAEAAAVAAAPSEAEAMLLIQQIAAGRAAGEEGTLLVPPDHRRRPLRKAEWIAEHFRTTGTPVGHGFAHRPASAGADEGYYAFSPRPGVRFVALDTVADGGLEAGNVDHPQYLWLEDELDAADAAGELVLVFAHHGLRTMGQPPVSPFPPGDADTNPDPRVHYGNGLRETPVAVPCTGGPRDDETIRCQLLRHRSVVAFVNGHEHNNRVTAITPLPGDLPGAAATAGFWEVNTASHIEWGQQSRVIDLVDNRDGTLSLFGTVVDHAAPPDPGGPPAPSSGRGAAGRSVQRMASISRELAFNDPQGSHGEDGEGGGRGSREDRNVELVLRHPFAGP